ncbi:hypothetical protein Misp02_54530 [Microtetraspora sp. NBRC 16547]|nr:hypothetical protein Misp02_54530 [Microtetraspora sp. NBRC 16547]
MAQARLRDVLHLLQPPSLRDRAAHPGLGALARVLDERTRHVCVPLGRGHPGVPEDLLNNADVDTLLDEEGPGGGALL